MLKSDWMSAVERALGEAVRRAEEERSFLLRSVRDFLACFLEQTGLGAERVRWVGDGASPEDPAGALDFDHATGRGAVRVAVLLDDDGSRAALYTLTLALDPNARLNLSYDKISTAPDVQSRDKPFVFVIERMIYDLQAYLGTLAIDGTRPFVIELPEKRVRYGRAS